MQEPFLTEEHIIFRESVRRFAENEITPLIEKAEREQKFPMEIIDKARDAGLMGITMPVKYGGSGADMFMVSILSEELSKVCSGIGVGLFSVILGGGAIAAGGSTAQREKYLPYAVNGTKVFCLALTEPDAGSDLGGIKMTARRNGDHYVLNGRKIFITNGTFADYCMTAAYIETDEGRQGMGMFIVDTKLPGFTVTAKMDKLGHRSTETAELLFEDVRVHKDDILGGAPDDKQEDTSGRDKSRGGDGFIKIMSMLDGGRIIVASRALGIAVAAYNAAHQYAQDRTAFGRPISKFQVTKFKLAKMAMDIDAARLMIYRAAWMASNKQRYTKEVSMAKLFASQVCEQVAAEALQIHGGHGYITEFPVERYFRDSKLAPITEGTSEIQHIIIAREIGL